MRIASHVRGPLVLVAISGLFACSDSVSPSGATEVLFLVSPEEMAPRASFTATLAIKNTSGARLKLTSGMGCISYLAVEEAPWGDPVKGTDFGCLAVVTEFRFRPGETLSWSWDLAAETSSGQALAPGAYHLEAALNVSRLEHPRAVFRVMEVR